MKIYEQIVEINIFKHSIGTNSELYIKKYIFMLLILLKCENRKLL